jgi:phytoene dehydrogenase-like protein
VIDAVVVGAGPNGLAAAVAIASEGFRVHLIESDEEVGGGARSRELTLPGLVHDVCSAFHPFAVASPFLAGLGLEAEGLRWRYTEIECAHPLDGGRVGALYRDVDRTAAALGKDGAAWRRLFEPLVRRFDAIAGEVLQPVLHIPRHPFALAGFGLRALLPATAVTRRWRTEEARALYGGCGAHAFYPLTRPTTAAIGTMLIASAHAVGWPVAEGGTGAITAALANRFASLGGTVETGVRVDSLAQLPDARVVLMDLSPRAVLRIAGERLAGRVARAFRRYRYGPAVFKLDLAVEGGVPWANDACARAGTVHVGGTLEEIVAAEAEVHGGRMPARPFMLLGQQYLADPSRSAGDVHPVWTYAHVPHGYAGDATEPMLAQIERFAPGFRERIVATHVTTAPEIEAYNPNYVGGDISTGANSPFQVVFRPRLAFDPYAAGSNVFICSAATPPGAGTHGMCGANAARSALRVLRADRRGGPRRPQPSSA